MSLELLSDLILEIVIDASGSFANRRADAFRQRVQNAVQGATNDFQQQEQQEKEINSRLAAVELIPDKFISQKRLRMASPLVFDPDEGVAPNASIFVAVELTSERDSGYVELSRYVRANSEQFLAALAAVKQAMADIEHDADAMRWPAPWRRYTQWGSWFASVGRFELRLKKMLALK